MFSEGWEQDKVNLAAFQFRKGSQEAAEEGGKNPVCLLPLRAINVMDGEFGRYTLHWQRLFNWGESCWDPWMLVSARAWCCSSC